MTDQLPTDSAGARNLQFGWWALLIYLLLGAVLEGMHALKVGWYLNVDNETRRLMWTLAHAHGTLLALINVAFAISLNLFPTRPGGALKAASVALLGATVLLPGGFFLGGIAFYDGDPGFGAALIPVGALLLLVGVLLTALFVGRGDDEEEDEPEEEESDDT